MSFRRRPLHTCGVSFLAISHSACSRAQDLGGPLGSMAKRTVRIAKIMSPLVFALQYQWLLVLSFIDDRLLAIEIIVEKIFPPSKFVFDKIDGLLHLIESFPGKFDDAVNKYSRFNEVTFLDWAVLHAISLLKFMMTILVNLGREGTGEKEILIDINCNEEHSVCELADVTECRSEGNVSSDEKQQAEIGTMKGSYKEVLEMRTKPVEDGEECKEYEKGTYKEVLEMGTKPVEDDEDCKKDEKGTYKEVVEKGTRESVEDKEDCTNSEKNVEKGIIVKVEDKEKCEKDETHHSQTTKMEGGEEAEGKDEKENVEAGSIGEEQSGATNYKYEEANNGSGSMENEDDILELFETAWLMKPTRKGKGNLLPRSASIA